MAILCWQCRLTSFRPSILRFSDIPRLLFLRFPVRCTICRERTHVFLPEFLKLRSTYNASRSKTSSTN